METPISPFTPTPEEAPLAASRDRGQAKIEFFEQYKFWILGTLVIIMGLGIYLILTPPTNTLAESGENIFVADTPATVTNNSNIVVDISGAIVNPGVYKLALESIVEDAIDAAGGFSDTADIEEIARSINRAKLIDNHSKIYLPKIGDNQIVYINPTTTSYTPSSSPSNNPTTHPLTNINVATSAELDKLPGIGPITAQRIIDYRLQNGDFSGIDGIKNVYGISDNKFNNLKDLIAV